MLISAITAVAENNVIGKDNTLPWHLPADMKFFKNTTLHHPVIMGRKTYDSFKKALPLRENIVITRRENFILPDAMVVSSLKEAIEKAKSFQPAEIFILGGAQIFEQSMAVTDRLYLTRIHENFDGDVLFPEIDFSKWEKIKDEYHASDEKNKYAYSFQTWERIR
jgi:dihydrofolate reductase